MASKRTRPRSTMTGGEGSSEEEDEPVDHPTANGQPSLDSSLNRRGRVPGGADDEIDDDDMESSEAPLAAAKSLAATQSLAASLACAASAALKSSPDATENAAASTSIILPSESSIQSKKFAETQRAIALSQAEASEAISKALATSDTVLASRPELDYDSDDSDSSTDASTRGSCRTAASEESSATATSSPTLLASRISAEITAASQCIASARELVAASNLFMAHRECEESISEDAHSYEGDTSVDSISDTSGIANGSEVVQYHPHTEVTSHGSGAPVEAEQKPDTMLDAGSASPLSNLCQSKRLVQCGDAAGTDNDEFSRDDPVSRTPGPLSATIPVNPTRYPTLAQPSSLSTVTTPIHQSSQPLNPPQTPEQSRLALTRKAAAKILALTQKTTLAASEAWKASEAFLAASTAPTETSDSSGTYTTDETGRISAQPAMRQKHQQSASARLPRSLDTSDDTTCSDIAASDEESSSSDCMSDGDSHITEQQQRTEEMPQQIPEIPTPVQQDRCLSLSKSLQSSYELARAKARAASEAVAASDAFLAALAEPVQDTLSCGSDDSSSVDSQSPDSSRASSKAECTATMRLSTNDANKASAPVVDFARQQSIASSPLPVFAVPRALETAGPAAVVLTSKSPPGLAPEDTATKTSQPQCQQLSEASSESDDDSGSESETDVSSEAQTNPCSPTENLVNSTECEERIALQQDALGVIPGPPTISPFHNENTQAAHDPLPQTRVEPSVSTTNGAMPLSCEIEPASESDDADSESEGDSMSGSESETSAVDSSGVLKMLLETNNAPGGQKETAPTPSSTNPLASLSSKVTIPLAGQSTPSPFMNPVLLAENAESGSEESMDSDESSDDSVSQSEAPPIPTEAILSDSEVLDIGSDSSIESSEISDDESGSEGEGEGDSDSDSDLGTSEEDSSNVGSSDDVDDGTGTRTTSSGRWTSDGDSDSYVDDLLNELKVPRAKPKESSPNPPMPGMPGMPAGGIEGLDLSAIRSELEKVGRAVMTQKSGEAFVARAQILTSINQLAGHVPAAVLDYLGKEIRAYIAKDEAKEQESNSDGSKTDMIELSNDDVSVVSDLSEAFLSDGDDSSDDEDEKSQIGEEGKKNQPEEKKATTPALMRRKSEEALDEMFKNAADDKLPEPSLQRKRSFDAIEKMFNGGGLTKKFEGGQPRRKSIVSSDGTYQSSKAFSLGSGSKSKSSSSRITFCRKSLEKESKLPALNNFECALLFVDISGFTRLSTLLDPETLSKVINSYFQLIVSKIYEFNGDIQKFAGDAIFAEWRSNEKHDMRFCVSAATACASRIVDECSDFPVMAGGANEGGDRISDLNVHCALGAGKMVGIHVGDNSRRREYLLLGEPIDQLTWGADIAKNGEFAVSPEAFTLLNEAGVLDMSVKPHEKEPAIIASREVSMFKPDLYKDYRVSQIEYARSRGVTNHVEGLELADLEDYQKLMSLYVHPVVAANHMDSRKKMKSKTTDAERHREDAELRRVYIMFIGPKIAAIEEHDFTSVKMLNEIMNLTSEVLEKYCGHLRQMIVDDKGLVLIGTFGLRGSTFPNMVSERALPATIELHNLLRSELGVENKIGATFGEVYCGAVGGVKRHEYAVLGPSANLAARLMGSKNNPGILVDCAIRRMASRKYGFNALPPVVAKGYAEPVPIFEPLTTLERSWGRIQPNFVGREPEIKTLMGMAHEIAKADHPTSKLVFVASQSGMGKSTMVAHSIEHIRNLIGYSSKRLIITKQVGKESDAFIPFGIFRSILLDVLSSFALATDDKSHVSGSSGLTGQSFSLQSLSCKSYGSSTALSAAKSEELLTILCRELNAPSGLVDHTLHHLTGKGGVAGTPIMGSNRAPSMGSMVSFLSRAFRRCTQETKLVVVALDDVQHVDEMSWKVLRQVFESCDNVLCICAFDITRSRDLRVEEDFWLVLNEKYRPSGDFVPMELGCLEKEDITNMIMKTLGLQREDVDVDLLNEVLIQSGGMPHFANEYLDMVKRRQFIEIKEGETKKEESFKSVPEIILSRIDSFDVSVRNVLNIGAVLGRSFRLLEIVAVLKEYHDTKEADLLSDALDSLNAAVSEGILIVENHPPSSPESKEEDNPVYSFLHQMWQTTILSLLLDSRKKDVHRKIAQAMEEKLAKESCDFEFKTKLLGHWKCSGDTSKLVKLALSLGKNVEKQLGLPTQSIRLYEEALSAWRDDNVEDADLVAGVPKVTLDFIGASDLSGIAELHVALGQALGAARRFAESVTSFQNAVQILQLPRAAVQVEDRSPIFLAYSELYQAIKQGHIIQDDLKRYQETLIWKFLDETRASDIKFHYVHAITCQIDLFRRCDLMEDAVETQKLLHKIYKFEEHSPRLRETYGSDAAALSFSNCAMWQMQLGNNEAALDACRFVIGKLMPKMDRSDVHQAFIMMYPVVLVMKDNGVAVQARKHFDRLVVQPFSTFFGEGKSSFFLPVYEPIMMLLHLAGSPDDIDFETMEEYTDWGLDKDRLSFGTLANRRLGALGRCADSISIEICFLLALRTQDPEIKHQLIQNGMAIGREAMSFNVSHGLTAAVQQLKDLLSKYVPQFPS